MSVDSGALRTPPHSVDAEQNVLGALLLVPESWHTVSDLIAEKDFYRRDHQMIYRAIQELHGNAMPPDETTLGNYFVDNGIAELVGGKKYIYELVNTTPSAANVSAYAEIVLEASRKRQLIDIGTAIAESAFKPGKASHLLADEAATQLLHLADRRGAGGLEPLNRASQLVFDRLLWQAEHPGELAGLSSPWASLDRLTDGFEPETLTILAARPSMGKTAWMLNLLAHFGAYRPYDWKEGDPVGLHGACFSVEMGKASVYRAMMAIVEHNLTRNWLRRPDMDDEMWARVTRAVQRLNRMPILLDASGGLSIHQISARARRAHQQKRLRWVAIDHAHILRRPGKQDVRHEIGDISKEGKALGKYLGCPVFLLSQLNRKLEERPDKRPMMADLKESGDLEQDADTIIMLNRDDYWAEREQRASKFPGFVEQIICKQREGEIGSVFSQWTGNRGLMTELGYRPEPQYVESKPKGARKPGDPL